MPVVKTVQIAEGDLQHIINLLTNDIEDCQEENQLEGLQGLIALRNNLQTELNK